jgi:hypothetical protein
MNIHVDVAIHINVRISIDVRIDVRIVINVLIQVVVAIHAGVRGAACRVITAPSAATSSLRRTVREQRQR